jgi:hypothetical protein
MLRKLRSGRDNIWCRMKARRMEPPTPRQPVLYCWYRQQLAPHVAFLRDRVRAAEERRVSGTLFSLLWQSIRG